MSEDIKLTLVEQAAYDFIIEMDKRNEEAADHVSSHRIFHLSVNQFNAFIALKRVIGQSRLTVQEQNGVKMLCTLQKVLGNNESPEVALEKWRAMPEPQKDEVWKMYKLISKE